MKLNLNTIIFTYMMTLGIIISISSNNWFLIWIGMEMSLMSFIPMMMSKTMLSSESSMKYFIIQSISSSLMMLGVLLMMTNSEMNFKMILTTSMIIKTGAAPFHNWVVEMIEGIEILPMFIMFTLMKVAPINTLSYMSSKMSIFSNLSLITGALMGINQNSIKKIMVYSSIFNLGFMMSSIWLNSMWIPYFLVYSIMLATFLNKMVKMNIMYVNQMMLNNNPMNKLSMWMFMLAMSGMPPMMTFFMKLMIMQTMIKHNETFTLLIMVMSSTLVMFYYMRITFTCTMNFSSEMKWKMEKQKTPTQMILMINLMMLPTMLTLKSLA